MPSLTDPLPDDQLLLVRTVADGFTVANGRWPVWQWVARQVEDKAHDASEILHRLPTWQLNYRPTWFGTGGGLPGDDTPVFLTVHGMWHADHTGVEPVTRAFIAALQVGNQLADEVQLTPTEAVRKEIDGQQLTQDVNLRAGTNLTSEQLHTLLQHEPATWSGLRHTGYTAWTWDVLRPRLSAYRDVASIEQYLQRLELVVGVPEFAVDYPPAPPLALVDALDHLDLAWHLATGSRLLHLPRAALTAKLALPAGSGEEFDSRCSALADVLNNWQVPGSNDQRPLQRMKSWLSQNLREDPARALTPLLQ